MAFNCVLLRIDSRLLHGQVVTSWLPALKVTHVLVVSDRACADPLWANLLVSAAPAGVIPRVVTVEQALIVNQAKAVEGLPVAVVVEDPQTALALITGGLGPTPINLGALSFSPGKQLVSDSVAVSSEDVQAFRQLHSLGCALTLQKVYSDRPRDFWKLLTNKGLVGELR